MQGFFVPAYVATGTPGRADAVTGAAGLRAIPMREEAVPCVHGGLRAVGLAGAARITRKGESCDRGRSHALRGEMWGPAAQSRARAGEPDPYG